MATPLTIPQLERSMTEGTLAEWLVDDGAVVAEGEPIYVLEADKTTQEIEAPVAGRLTRQVSAGATYPVGTQIGEIS